MNQIELVQLAGEALKLDQRIKRDQADLKKLKGLLIAEAAERPGEQLATEGGGTRLDVPLPGGELVRVTFPADALKDKIDPASKEGAKILERFVNGSKHAARTLRRYFSRQVVYRPLDDFRERVEQDFPPKVAESLIARCEKDSDPSVSFETAKKVKPEEAATDMAVAR
jgi:hypothetical protein